MDIDINIDMDMDIDTQTYIYILYGTTKQLGSIPLCLQIKYYSANEECTMPQCQKPSPGCRIPCDWEPPTNRWGWWHWHWLDPILYSANWEHQQLMLQSFILAQSLVSGALGW